MLYSLEEVIKPTIREFELLDQLVGSLSDEDLELPLQRPESKDPWTVKDALAHIAHWKVDVIRSIRVSRRPPEGRGLQENDGNHLVYMRWRNRSPPELLEWHRQVHEDLLIALSGHPKIGSAAVSVDRHGCTTWMVTLATIGLRISNGH